MPIGGRPFGRAPLGGTGFSPSLFQALVLQIGPIDVTPILLWGTYRLMQELNGRDELECELHTSTEYVPGLGEQIILSYQSGLLFVGTVHERSVEFLSEADSVHSLVRVRAVDLNAICDRRMVVEVFENQTAGAIVRAIAAKYLASELIQLGDVQEGPMVTRMVAPYLTVTQCLNELSEQSGFHWNIDQQRTLSFHARTSMPAPFTITSANAVFRGMRGSRTRSQYRNVQYVDGGHGITDPRTESFKGDGVLRTFPLEYPVYRVPTITKNFAPQSVGIRGVETGKQWYWNTGETAIGHDPAEPVLLSTDVLHVDYQGRFNLFEIVEDTSAILERLSVEGGTGRYEQVHRGDNLDGAELVEEKGLSLLRRYASMDDVIEFETDVPGLGIGQLLTVDVPELGQAGSYLITNLETTFIRADLRRFRVTATTGEIKGRFQDLFAQLLGASRAVTIRDGEILQEVMAMHDPVGVTDSIEATLIDVTADEFGTGEFGTAEMGP